MHCNVIRLKTVQWKGKCVKGLIWSENVKTNRQCNQAYENWDGLYEKTVEKFWCEKIKKFKIKKCPNVKTKTKNRLFFTVQCVYTYMNVLRIDNFIILRIDNLIIVKNWFRSILSSRSKRIWYRGRCWLSLKKSPKYLKRNHKNDNKTIRNYEKGISLNRDIIPNSSVK